MDTVVYHAGGNLIMRNCLISTKPLADTVRGLVPTIVSLQNSRMNLVSCDIKGNENILNAGIVSLNADLLISHCDF